MKKTENSEGKEEMAIRGRFELVTGVSVVRNHQKHWNYKEERHGAFQKQQLCKFRGRTSNFLRNSKEVCRTKSFTTVSVI